MQYNDDKGNPVKSCPSCHADFTRSDSLLVQLEDPEDKGAIYRRVSLTRRGKLEKILIRNRDAVARGWVRYVDCLSCFKFRLFSPDGKTLTTDMSQDERTTTGNILETSGGITQTEGGDDNGL